MRTSFKFVAAVAMAMSITGYARSASNQDAIPFPPPNPFRTATPAPSPSKAAAPAPNPPKAAAPAPNPPKAAAPIPTPSKAEAAPAYDHQTAAGFWQETDDQGRPGAWFLFVEKDGLYEGRFVKMFKGPGEQELIQTCQRCTGDQKDAPMLGLTIVKGMKRNGNKYAGGTILDPRDGTVYHAQMELSADGQQLWVRGYLGIPLLGQTQIWTRLPDDAVAPEDIPEDSTGPDATPK
jgi:uncharacterized protein (DUF2147 family)